MQQARTGGGQPGDNRSIVAEEDLHFRSEAEHVSWHKGGWLHTGKYDLRYGRSRLLSARAQGPAWSITRGYGSEWRECRRQ